MQKTVKPTPNATVFVITDVFPPMAAVGVYRTAALCRCLVEQGVNVKVITARHWDDEHAHQEMLQLVPKQVQVVRTASPHLLPSVVRFVKFRHKARRTGGNAPVVSSQTATAVEPASRLRVLNDWLSWWLQMPDTRVGWMPRALAAGLREARRSRPQVIYCTAPGWTSLVVGALLSCFTKVPLLADFQDPWCGSFWRRIPYAAHRWVDQRLEHFVVHRASRITCAWDGIRKHLVSRYPNRAEDIRTILNGFDPEEVSNIQPVRLAMERCVLLHAGTFYGPRSPEPLLAALRQLRSESPDTARRLLIAFLGRPYHGKRSLSGLARNYGVEDLVRIIPPVARGEALALTKGADVALLFGQSGYEALASVPAKTFDYVGFRLPVLAIGTGTEACDVLRRGGCRLWEAPSSDIAAIAVALRDIAAWHDDGRHCTGQPDGRHEFAWPSFAARMAGEVRLVGAQAPTLRA